jgi:undecaprenyl-diphosphatase
MPLDATLVRSVHGSVPHAQQFNSFSGIAALVVAVAAILVLARQRRYRIMALWCATVGGVLVLDPVLKHLVGRPSINVRSSDLSFPSGTSMLFMAVALLLLGTLPPDRRRLAAWAATPLVVAQGVTLVTAQWHYPSDVVAGWCVAVVWLSVLLVAFNWIDGLRVSRASLEPSQGARQTD